MLFYFDDLEFGRAETRWGDLYTLGEYRLSPRESFKVVR